MTETKKKKRDGSWNVLGVTVLTTLVWVKLLSTRVGSYSAIFFTVLSFLTNRFREDIDQFAKSVKRHLFSDAEWGLP